MTIFKKRQFTGLFTRNVLLTVITIVLFLFVPGCSNRYEKTGRPNIIVVLADDQGWGDMAYNGHPVLQTPNFDDMASAGLQFERFYAVAPVCSPTKGSIMTGSHPNRFGCFTWGFSLHPKEYTIAEALKKAGYATGHFGKCHLGSVRNGSLVNPVNSGFEVWISSPNFFENDHIVSHNGTAIQHYGESSIVTMEAALNFIENHKDGEQPFFAYVCFGSPHRPHIASDEDKEFYHNQSGRLKNFYGEITGMHHAMGILRKKLLGWGIENNTVLWYLSDNGGLPQLGSTGVRGYKGQIYEGGLRVPAIIQWPERISAHRVANMPCNTYDISPTLMQIAGIENQSPHLLDGISLLPLIDDRVEKREKPMAFWQYTSTGKRVSSEELMIALFEEQKNNFSLTDSSLLDLNTGPIICLMGKILETTIEDYGPDIVSDYIIEFIERNQENPFFVYYPMILAPNPFTPTPNSPEWQKPELRNKQDNKLFKYMVEYTDKIVGKIINKLDELNFSNNTTVIFTEDKGTNTKIVTKTKNGHYKGGKGSHKDKGTDVPLGIQWPAAEKKGIITYSLVEFSDFIPTLAQAAGITLKEPSDGVSFLDLFYSPYFEARKSIFVHYYPRTRQVISSNGCFGRTIDCKLYSDGRFYDMVIEKWKKIR